MSAHDQRICVTSVAFDQASRLSSIAGRAEDRGVTPGRRRIAREAFERSLRDLVRHEDLHGTEYVAWVHDLLTRARQGAVRTGVLTPEDVSRIEREVCAS